MGLKAERQAELRGVKEVWGGEEVNGTGGRATGAPECRRGGGRREDEVQGRRVVNASAAYSPPTTPSMGKKSHPHLLQCPSLPVLSTRWHSGREAHSTVTQ